MKPQVKVRLLFILLGIALAWYGRDGIQVHAQTPMTSPVIVTDYTSALGYTPLNPANNLSDVGSAATSRSNLGLGGASTQAAILSGTTSAISGTLTGVGTCTSATTVTIAGAATNMGVVVSPTTFPGASAQWFGWVSASNTVSIEVCSLLATLTLTSSTYNVRVIQ
jgi:hypothetical protein